jgi:hypothetical protein
MVRMLKLVKERNMLVSYLNDILKLSAGVERMFYFSWICIIICHICACLWVLLAKLEGLQPDSWINSKGLLDYGNFDVRN